MDLYNMSRADSILRTRHEELKKKAVMTSQAGCDTSKDRGE